MGITEGLPTSAAGHQLSPGPATEAGEREAVLLIRGIGGRRRVSDTRWHGRAPRGVVAPPP
jgi:hypothetical protein